MRFLILSDTHDSAFPTELPSADVVLHCGDLTTIGGLSNYKAAIKSLAACDAELKLVIPGNHDVSMDPTWWTENLDEEDDDDPEEPVKAHQLFESAAADNTGIRLLEEGIHNLTLKDGRSFSIFASPYTPAFGGYAFACEPNEDHWSCIPENVDIAMTHGPPLAPGPEYRLDLGHKNEHCGCPNLRKHVERTRPRLHCFGHIHEGYGACRVNWKEDGAIDNVGTEAGAVMDCKLEGTDQTLLVNAAIMTHSEEENNRPWLVDLEYRKS